MKSKYAHENPEPLLRSRDGAEASNAGLAALQLIPCPVTSTDAKGATSRRSMGLELGLPAKEPSENRAWLGEGHNAMGGNIQDCRNNSPLHNVESPAWI